MRKLPSPKTDRAVQLLIDLIGRLSQSGEKRLPTVQQLSRKTGVSPTTVCKALALLKKQGLVTASPRRGISISAPRPGSAVREQQETAVPDSLSMLHWEAVKKAVVADMLRGIFPPGTLLPSSKELLQRYQVCFRTLQRALKMLLEEGRLTRFKRGYRVFQTPQRYTRPLLVVIVTWPRRADDFISSDPRRVEFWRTLERECHRLSMDYELYSIAEVLGTKNLVADRHRQYRSRVRHRTIAGYFIWIQEVVADELNRLCTDLAVTGKSVSLLDDMGTAVIPGIVSRNRLFKLFSMFIGPASGRMVGDYLVGLGHRRIACFTPFANLSWSRNRIEGIQQAGRFAGQKDAVTEFGEDAFDTWYTLHNLKGGAQPFTDLQEILTRARKRIDPDIDPADLTLYRHARDDLWNDMLKTITRPLFDRAARDERITAWVGLQDTVALLALGYLRRKGIRVPQDVSVTGFDDTPPSIDAGLTSYNFNISATTLAMLDHILGGRMTRGIGGSKPVEIPGIIMERATTGKAREKAVK